MVTETPAAIAGLTDRGSIGEGKRADIIAVDDRTYPVVLLTISAGKIVHNMLYNQKVEINCGHLHV
jgi:alpha-D-ribose 1-methylphosphonate 5-triphosphate diphosphatase PhnM